jgi:hypothetical protein
MLTLLLCLTVTQVAPPPPPRDARPPGESTGVISGVVTAADTGLPLRRAQVMLLGARPTAPRPSGQVGMNPNPSVLTDHEGRFEFTGLGPGSYRVRAMPGSFRGQYLAAGFGTTSQMNAGKAIELKDGQRFDKANVVLQRGAAINGRVIDEFGEPVSRVTVYAARVVGGSGRIMRTGGGFLQTDDLGRFRVYGLEAGEYVVAAESRGMGMGGPPVEGETEGFATTYFPSALSEREASRIRVSAGGESGEIQIQLVRTRTFRITGMVMDSKGQLATRPNAMLMRRSVAGTGMSGSGVSFDQAGRFTIRDVVPGEYRLVVRPAYMGGQPPPGLQVDKTATSEYASVPLSVNGNIDDLVVVTKPGVSITGEIHFADGMPSPPPQGLRVSTMPGEGMTMMGPVPSAEVGSNMQFTLNNAFGPLYVRLSGAPRGYAMKEVLLGRSDITDTPVEFTAEHNKQLQIVLTNRVATLEGTVTDDNGAAPTEGIVLVIPEDKKSWRIGSPRMRTVGMPTEGKYSASGLLPGRYYVIAVGRDRMPGGPDTSPEYFEQLTKEATMVVLNDGETRTVDLRLSKGTER